MKKLFALFTLLIICIPTQSQIDKQLEGVKHKRSNGYVWPKDSLVLDKLDKWEDLKFGIIIHWGLYSVPGIVESWSLCGEDIDWIKRTPGMTYEDYKKWYWGLKDSLNPINFHPDDWADLMYKGGMRYVVFTTKHHEGFCMFDTKQTDFSIMHGPFGKDPRANVAKYVFDSFRKKNFMIGAYFSKPDWYSDYFWWRNYPTANGGVNYIISKHPERWDKFCNYTYNQIQELTTEYGNVDILWLDGGRVSKANGMDIHMERIAEMARKNRPGIIIVDRTVKGEFENYQTPEGEIPDEQLNFPWETCMSLNGWGWRADNKFQKSVKKVICCLIEVVAKGGNFLLGAGPTGKGEFDSRTVRDITAIGKWMDKNGKAIYSTRTVPHYNDGNVWFTRTKDGRTMYALYALSDKEEEVPEVVEWTTNIPIKNNVHLVENGKKLKCEVNGNKVRVYLPKDIDRKNSISFSFEVNPNQFEVNKVVIEPKEDETLVYSDPTEPIYMKPGDNHPTQKGWHFFTAHEFKDKDVNPNGVPFGFEDQMKWFQEYAAIDNGKCMKVKNGILSLQTIQEPDSITNFFGNRVKYSTYSTQTVSYISPQYWGTFTTNMRYEVRMRCSHELGFNHALWFMPESSRCGRNGGASYTGWPDCGEIDLLETPRAKANEKAWFTLHSKNYNNKSTNGSVYKTLDLADMNKWHIYWIELTDKEIRGGINGECYFVHHYGDNGNIDWPWNNDDGWFFQMTPGLSFDKNSWMGAANPSEWNTKRPPYMQIDWIRVYTNDMYKGAEPPKAKYY